MKVLEHIQNETFLMDHNTDKMITKTYLILSEYMSLDCVLVIGVNGEEDILQLNLETSQSEQNWLFYNVRTILINSNLKENF